MENYFLRNIASLGMQLEMIRGGTIILLDTVDRPISNWIIRISAAVVRGVVSIVQWLLLRRSVEKSFKKISFHAYKLRANGYNKDEGEEKMRERLFACFVRALSACGYGGNFSFLEGVFFLIQYCFSCKYGGRGWCRSNSLPGSNPRLDLDRFTSRRHLSRQFWAESGSSGDILARETGEMSLEPRISNR